jgi:tetratricopeptide (TPR) repeat protein
VLSQVTAARDAKRPAMRPANLTSRRSVRVCRLWPAVVLIVAASSCRSSAGPQRWQQPGKPSAPAAAPVAAVPVACLLGDLHDPIFALHQIDKADPEAFTKLAQALTASDLIRLTDPAIRAQLTEVAVAPNDASALMRGAELLSQERRFGVASLFLDHAAQAQHDDPEVFRALGDALMEFGRPSLAIEAYDRAVELKIEDAALWEKLARACLAEGRMRDKSPRSTRTALQKVRELGASEDSRLWAETALVRLDMAEGKYRGPRWDAKGDDGKPLGIGPLRVRTTASFEKAQLAREPAEKLELLAEAVQEDHGSLGAVYDLALALMDAERWVDAVPHLEEARKLGAKSDPAIVPDAMAGEAICLAHLGKGTEADPLARAAIEAAPESAFARYAHARVAWLAQNPAMAEERATQALERWPEHGPSLMLLGECLKARGDAAAARRALDYALWAECSPSGKEKIRDLLRGVGGSGDAE